MGTLINTDQGIFQIETLDKNIHTINNKLIKHITKTVTLDKYLISFKKNAIGRNIPSQTTIMSKDHHIEFEGKLVPAYRFLDYSELVKKVAYNGEVLYNVLMLEYGTMSINNLICETLHPENIVAKLYMNITEENDKNTIILKMNTALLQRDLSTYNNIIHNILLKK